MFKDDKEKVLDMRRLTKDEFLESYSYLTEAEYDETLHELMKDEAVKRMKILDLHENVIHEFENESKLNLSERQGFLYWLFVSRDMSTWSEARHNLQANISFSYCNNIDSDFCSEFGYIAFKKVNGGLKRTE